LRPGQGVPGDGARAPHDPARSDLRRHREWYTVDFAVSQARKNEVVDTLFKGLSGLLKGRSVTVLEGTGQLNADLSVTVLDGADAGTTVSGRTSFSPPVRFHARFPASRLMGRSW
jgi:pyruvate/2-oxoglutarate dehydrogenase complex dihydrolipoamide dehydrogenase (E3) component